MSERGFPVHIEVTRPDGSMERVRVGTAIKSGEGFVLRLGEMTIGGEMERTASAPQSRSASYGSASYGGGSGGGGGGEVFPNYGRSKGAPIHGASMGDLEFYANGARRTLGDPAKARFHDKERALLAAIEAEIARQRGGAGGGMGGPSDEEPPFPGDEDAPF